VNQTAAQIPIMHHVNLKTTRLKEMIDWYGTVIGLKVVHEYDRGAWLTNDEANHRLAFIAVPELTDDPQKLNHSGLHHTAFEYSSMGDLLESYSRLKELGIVPHASLDHGMTMSFYYVDPDSNSVELQADVFGDWSASKDFMLNDPRFAADPIGTPVDPDKVVAAHRDGLSSSEIHERAYAGEYRPEAPLDLHIPAPAEA
jgi:catechol 2,3-dioxygenase